MPTHHRTRDLKARWRRDDARKLAQLFNESHEGWPGGFGEAERRPQEMRREVAESGALAIFVAEADGRIVAYCTLEPPPAQPGLVYVGLLNAHPKYHGKGFGKAVLLSAIEKAYALGYDRVDLGTWAGNLKAVPLYKKSGFMWRPETRVHMENFTPLIRRLPLARAFFAKHDWYETQVRDLALKEDVFKRGKVRVYEYVWEAEGDRLRVVIDRQSWGPLEIETNDLRVACFLPDEELVAGLPHPIRWEIENKRGGRRQVTLIAAGEPGVQIDTRRTLSVTGSARARGEFVADPQMPEKEQPPWGAIISTTMLLDGEAVELKAGFNPLQAVNVRTDPTAICLRPGRREPVRFEVTSNLDKGAEFRPHLEALGEVAVEHRASALALPPRGTGSFAATLTAPRSGPVPLEAGGRVRVAGRTIAIKPFEQMLRALQGTECAGSASKHNLVLESATLRVEQSRRGGSLRIFDKVRLTREPMYCYPPRLGPPFAWEEFFSERAEARVEQMGDAAVGLVTSESATRRGVRLQRRIRLAAGPLVEISDTIINGSAQRLEARLGRGAGTPWGQRGTLLAPTARGVMAIPRMAPGPEVWALDLHDEPEFWPEGWLAAVDEEGFTCGVIFARPHRVHVGWGLGAEVSLGVLGPGESATAEPFYVFAGEGGHLAVRRWWQTLFGGERVDFKERMPAEATPLEFGLEPRVVVAARHETKARAVVKAAGRKKHTGTLKFAPRAGVRVSVRQMPFREVNEDLSAGRAVTLTRGAQERVSEVGLTLDTGEAVLQGAAPVIALGKPGARVQVRKRGAEWVIGNGVLAAVVAPGFCGSVVSLKMGSEEFLRSSYPEPQPLAWWNPWHGGIRPAFHGLGGNLWEEIFVAQPVARTGAQGVRWSGVRLTCRPKHRSARHLRLTMDYLLAPGSAVMAVAFRTARAADTSGHGGAGIELWPLLGGSALAAAFSCEAHPGQVRRRTEWNHHLLLGSWGMAENPRTGHAILLASGCEEARLDANIIGKPGYVLGAHLTDRIPPRGSVEGVFFVVAGRDAAQVRSFSALAGLKELP